MVVYQLCVRSGKDEPAACRLCSKLTRGMMVLEDGRVFTLCPEHLTAASAERVLAEESS